MTHDAFANHFRITSPAREYRALEPTEIQVHATAAEVGRAPQSVLRVYDVRGKEGGRCRSASRSRPRPPCR